MPKNKKEFSLYERLLRSVAPESLNKRLIAQMKSDMLVRQYDAARSPQNNTPILRNSKSQNKELTNSINAIRENVREVVRNQPVAVKAVQVITNAVAGWGIEASIKHPDKIKEQILKDMFKDWSKNCSVDGGDFNSLQHRIMKSVVQDGESIVREVILDGYVKLQLLEADYISTYHRMPVKENEVLSNGIISDRYNRPVSYCMYEYHPGDDGGRSKIIVTPASEILHIFKRDRPGQNRGVSWFAPVLHSIYQLDQIQYTQLQRLQLAAALTAVVTKEQSSLAPELQQAQFQDDWNLSPGSVMRINPGESVSFPTIPNPDGFPEQVKTTLRMIASGLAITYEALASDLSNVNFSSARIGNLQFNSNVDAWRWQMLIPQFCEPAFKRFLKHCVIKGVDTTGVTVEWVPPVHQLVDPQNEIAAQSAAIRAGLQTLPNALKELGYDPETHLQEIAASNTKLDELGLVLDSDPRYIGNGQQASADSLAAIQANQAKAKAKNQP